MKVSFQRFAQEEYFSAIQWYSTLDVRLADRFELAVGQAVHRIGEDPDSLPVETKHYRVISIRGFPYRLIFEHLESEKVLIIAVAHTSRRPGYWSKRSST